MAPAVWGQPGMTQGGMAPAVWGQPGMTQGGMATAVWGAQPGGSPSYTAMKPRQTNGSKQEWQEILNKINVFIDSRGISICELRTTLPEYGRIITALDQSGDKHALLCYASAEAWSRRPDVRADIVQVLTNAGVLQPVVEAPPVQTIPEAIAVTPEPVLGSLTETTVSSGAASSHADVLSKITAYLKVKKLEICDLRNAIPAYGKIIDKLEQEEKYKAEMGAPRICYPSPEVWEADTKGVKTEIMTVLKENGIL